MSAAEKTDNVIPMVHDQGIVAYNEFYGQLAELKEVNEKTVFQYHDPKGNKAARSYVSKLRSTKSAIEQTRKQEKAASLEYGRKVDSIAKDLTAQVESMIQVHWQPLEEIENKEKERVAAIRARIDRIKTLQEATGLDSKETAHNLERLRAVSIDSSFAEFQEEAKQELEMAIQKQQHQNAFAVLQEAEVARQEQTRQAEAARVQKEREETIAREAAEKATQEAEQRAKDAAEAESARVKAAAEKSENDRLAAEREAAQKLADAEAATKRAQLEAEQAAQRERDRIANEQKAEAEATAKREADKAHRAKINNAAHEAIRQAGISAGDISDAAVKAIVIAIAKGEVPNVKIIY